MFIASVRLSVRPSVCLKPKFGRLKTKFDDDAGSAKRPRKTKSGPTFYLRLLFHFCDRIVNFKKFERLHNPDPGKKMSLDS